MNTIRLCPGCGHSLPTDAPAGLCPRCLLQSQTHPAGDSALPAPALPQPGQTFGDYRILRLLGHGGMGEVFEAEHLGQGRRVALKVMRHTLASEADRKRFLREGRLAASVSHPNVVYVHGSEEIEGAPAIAMELVHGGTLRNRLKEQGPLTVAEAVAMALQILDGLEAAHSAGVLHRDIKPANCFVAADGTVKVGDFGLSVSTLARGESLVTATGAVMGTPAYASPEQLRGEELDVTSDIYSVGATLYHLLTGQTPFQATEFVKLITEVLDKEPAAPKSYRADLPAGLSKVLLRCLAKDRRARFQSYAELRDALLPFRAAEFTPAPPSRRFLASLIDEMLAYGPSVFFLIYFSMDPMERFLRERTWTAGLIWFGFFSWYALYYMLGEGLWGAGVGKALCGLRVVGLDRQAPGLLRAAGRMFLLSSALTAPLFFSLLLRNEASGSVGMNQDDFTVADWLWLPLLALLCSTMRARNGYAGIHDLLTRTRVIVVPKSQPRPAGVVAPSEASAQVPAAQTKLGVFNVTGILWKRGNEQLLSGLDPTLQRKVWIHLRPLGAPPVEEARRALSRASRLRWIQGGCAGDVLWEAYEAPEGRPLLAVAPLAGRWAAVRFWLLDLSEELLAVLREQRSVPPLSLDRVWLTTSGRAVWLDFPAPGVPSGTGGPEFDPLDESAAQRFLSAVASAALSESARSAEPQPPLPLPALSFLTRLARASFDKMEMVVGNLQSLVARPAEVVRRWRVASLALVPVVTLLLGGLLAAMLSFERIRWERHWSAAYPGQPSPRAAARLYLAASETQAEGETPIHPPEDIALFITAHFRPLLTNESFWSSPPGQMLSPEDRGQLLKALEAQPNPQPENVTRVNLEIQGSLQEREKAESYEAVFAAGVMLVLLPLLAALLELAGLLGFRGSPLLRLFGMTILDRSGAPAGRMKLLARWFLSWALWLGATGFFFLAVAGGFLAPNGPVAWISYAVLAVLVLGGGAWIGQAVWRPWMTLADRLCGTRLAPV